MPGYVSLVAEWRALGRRDGFGVREVACVGATRTLLAAELVRPGAPVVSISAGVHGDEPAAPWALLAIVRDGLLDDRFGYRLWPCTNPSGYVLGTRANAEGDDINRGYSRGGTTPEAKAIVTANRDRRFALTLDLHEDYEADGFYCYEPVVGGTAPLGGAIVTAIDEAGLPVQELETTFDLGYPVEAEHLRGLERGRVLPNVEAERKYFTGLPFSLYALRRATRRALTIESPRSLPWNDRIATHRVAVTAALATAGRLVASDAW